MFGRVPPSDNRSTPLGITVAGGTVVVVGAAVLASAVSADVSARLAVVLIAVAAFAVLAGDAVASLAVAGLGYLIFNGFLVNRLGELTWDGTTGAGQLVAFAVAIAPGLAWQSIRAVRRDSAFAAEFRGVLNHSEPTEKELHGA